MTNLVHRNLSTPKGYKLSPYQEEFLEDIVGIFPDKHGYAPNAGNVGKYLYDDANWDNIIEHDESYYPPQGETRIFERFVPYLKKYGIPQGLHFIDFGVGGIEPFQQHALPILKTLQARRYTGVDFCKATLHKVASHATTALPQCLVDSINLDFFFPSTRVIANDSNAFGTMLGLTLTNIPGKTDIASQERNLIASLKYLAQLCGHGWLMLTIDTNQNIHSLQAAYSGHLFQNIILSLFRKVERELPTDGYDPELFGFSSEFISEKSLWAHQAIVKKNHKFLLGDYQISIEAGQKIHINNSYKWSSTFFETCCKKASLQPVDVWMDESGIAIYLLRSV